VATIALLATATSVATVALSDALARAGRRGPFEVLLRGATYGRRQRASERWPSNAASIGCARTSGSSSSPRERRARCLDHFPDEFCTDQRS
jgi:hypothetical protein